MVPEMLRPILRDWWERHGRPTEGPIFPVRLGSRAGEYRGAQSHAEAFRRDLRRAFGVDCMRETETVRRNGRRLTKIEWIQARALTARERVLFEETATTLPVDLHSWRRAYCQALADADVTAQKAKALAGHSTE
jgi:hypothetical protein